MSDEMIFEGQSEKDAVRAACQKMLVEPKMVEYEVLEEKEAVKTRFRTSRAYCKIKVTAINRKVVSSASAKSENSEKSQGESEKTERSESRSRDRREPRENRRDKGRRGSQGRSRAPEKPMDPEMVAQSAERAQKLVSELLEQMGFGDTEINTEENDQRVFVRVKSEDSILIGEDGEVLSSIQYIVNAAINWKLRGKKIVIERAGAREEREKELSVLAREMAQKVIDTGESMALQPMHSADRRLVHQALNDMKGVTTQSEGSGGFRCIRILPE